MIRARLSLPVAGLLALAVAACSSGSPTTGPGGVTQAPGATAAPTQNGASGSFPCAAIQADVVSATGKTLAQTDFSIANHCEFKFGGTADVAGVDGVVNVRQEAANNLDAVKLGFPGGDDVSGLGDAAYWAKSVSVLYSTFHGHTYAVQLVLFAVGTDEKTVATKIMQSLLAHV
jgi:hypothetical protein